MSRLIDKLIENSADTEVYIDGEWYIAKPLNRDRLWSRIKDALAVLIGRSQAFHYFEAHTVCIRTSYDLYECSCKRCIKLDKHREKING